MLFAQGKVAQSNAQHQLALERAVRSGNVECEAQAHSGLGDAQYVQGRMLSALAVGSNAGGQWSVF